MGYHFCNKLGCNLMPCDARKTPYLGKKHGNGKKNVSKPGISIIKCISLRKKHFLATQILYLATFLPVRVAARRPGKKFSLEHCKSEHKLTKICQNTTFKLFLVTGFKVILPSYGCCCLMLHFTWLLLPFCRRIIN